MANIEKFDQMASKYESESRVQVMDIITAEVNKLNLSGTLLDFGCGTGNIGLSLASQFEHVYLLDPATKMQEIIRQKITSNKLENCSVLGDNLEEGNNLELKVDLIIIAQVLLHLPNYQDIISKLTLSLKPSGQLIICDYHYNPNVSNPLVHNGFKIDELGTLLEVNNFTNINYHDIYEGNQALLGSYGKMFMLSAKY